MIAAAGLTHPEQIKPETVVRISEIELKITDKCIIICDHRSWYQDTQKVLFMPACGLATAEHFQAQTHSHS